MGKEGSIAIVLALACVSNCRSGIENWQLLSCARTNRVLSHVGIGEGVGDVLGGVACCVLRKKIGGVFEEK